MPTMLEERNESTTPVRFWPAVPAFGDRFFHKFMEDMERAFEDFTVMPEWKMRNVFEPRSEKAWIPRVDVFEKNGQFMVRADLPGLKKEEVKVEVTEAGLTLEGERKLEKEEKREGFYRAERAYGSFFRMIPLPEGVNVEKSTATFKDGVLEVALPVIAKKEEAQARRLEIKG